MVGRLGANRRCGLWPCRMMDVTTIGGTALEFIYHAIIHAILHKVVRPAPYGRGEDLLKLCMRVESEGQR